jgi:hypothetical protein
MPSRITIYRWVENDSNGFRTQYKYAREAQAHYFADLIRDVAFDDSGDFFIENGRMVIDHARVQRARLKVDTLKWIAARFNRAYSEKPLPEVPQHSGEIVFRWEANDPGPPPVESAPPKQLQYFQPTLPGDLTPEDWSIVMDVLQTIKRTIPSNSEEPPGEVFEIIRKALLAHFRETA